eukprot:CAMPEP_0171568404 /NCGR_PEP_ID=MMETSP0961-20121227/1742_1 /TAXON_ID=87120 /ORGANISM="Aurantiochytrium limacinum, Strain ATCCMYA-1381" /LENGTH=62 /DNA_ID=CAMNT_0012122523 /DNA_START=387 /DNA_END=572 /DNA_ORIENTATION=-
MPRDQRDEVLPRVPGGLELVMPLRNPASANQPALPTFLQRAAFPVSAAVGALAEGGIVEDLT